jgi:hypothetical protein
MSAGEKQSLLNPTRSYVLAGADYSYTPKSTDSNNSNLSSDNNNTNGGGGTGAKSPYSLNLQAINGSGVNSSSRSPHHHTYYDSLEIMTAQTPSMTNSFEIEMTDATNTSAGSRRNAANDDEDADDDDNDDDLITMAVKSAYQSFDVLLHGWLISLYVALLLDLFVWKAETHSREETNNQKPSAYFNLLFYLPMTAGTLIAMILMIAKLRSVYQSGFSLISRERQLFLIADNKRNEIKEKYILYESFPLMRSYFCLSAVFLVVLFLIASTQVLLMIWSVQPVPATVIVPPLPDNHSSTHVVAFVVSLWGALTPLVMVAAAGLFYATIMTRLPPFYVGLLYIVALDGILFVDNIQTRSRHDWELVIVPAIFVQACLCAHLLYILFNACACRCCCRRKYVLQKPQSRAAWMMLISFAMMIAAEILSLRDAPLLGRKSSNVASSPVSQPTFAPSVSESKATSAVDSASPSDHTQRAFMGSHHYLFANIDCSVVLPQGQPLYLDNVWRYYGRAYEALVSEPWHQMIGGSHDYMDFGTQFLSSSLSSVSTNSSATTSGGSTWFPELFFGSNTEFLCTVLWIVAWTLLTEAILVIIQNELVHAASTRGFVAPTPLSLTNRGWCATAGANIGTGDVEIGASSAGRAGFYGSVQRWCGCNAIARCEGRRMVIRSPLLGLIGKVPISLEELEALDALEVQHGRGGMGATAL